MGARVCGATVTNPLPTMDTILEPLLVSLKYLFSRYIITDAHLPSSRILRGNEKDAE